MRRLGASLVALIALGALAGSAAGSPAAPAPQYPNLVPLPAFDLDFDQIPGDPPGLRFAVATANRGNYALDLFGRPDGSTSKAPAEQCVAWATDRVCSGRETVGSFVWHPEHAHYHFEDFALYELRRFRGDGRVDMSRRGLVASSGKVSFCVIDVERDRDPDSPLYTLPHPLYNSCLSAVGFQGISPGWRDVYGAGTPGQFFPLRKLSAGRFALLVVSDPAGRLFETDESDNRAVAGIQIDPGARDVEVFCISEPGSIVCDQPPPR